VKFTIFNTGQGVGGGGEWTYLNTKWRREYFDLRQEIKRGWGNCIMNSTESFSASYISRPVTGETKARRIAARAINTYR
jgi:hypothetical protein